MLHSKCFVMDKITSFVHIESRGKNGVTNLIKLQSTLFFLHTEPIYIVFISVC